jgi:hypothetical protein
MQVVLQTPYPNRVKLSLDPMRGPLTNPDSTIGNFNPSRDLSIYNGGKLMVVDSSNYDAATNSYYIFLKGALDFNAVTQVIHHMPNPPFEGEANPTLNGLSRGGHPSIVNGALVEFMVAASFDVVVLDDPRPWAFNVFTHDYDPAVLNDGALRTFGVTIGSNTYP